ncbi:MAG: hypothetical protein HC892_01735 [Saprospiraceae bacterium]|nr:hypothetical protein [Saprospiraceae bacterium]
MKRLKELVSIISKLKVNQIQIVGNRYRRRNKSDEFYDKLLKDEFKDDDEAAQYFFGTDGKSRNYQILKKRFEANLLNTVFFIDYRSNELRVEQRVYFQLLREITACKIFTARGIHQLSVEILQRCLKKAVTYGFTEFAYDAAKLLGKYYGTIEFNRKSMKIIVTLRIITDNY